MTRERKVSVALRFIRITEEEAGRVMGFCPEAKRHRHKDHNDQFTVSFKLKEQADYSWVGPLLEEKKVPRTSCNLFVSVVTEYDSEIVSLPDFALTLQLELAIGIDFSFTVVFPEDDSE